VTRSPLREFFSTEAAGGVVLVVATAAALVWANSPWKESYFHLWHTHLSLGPTAHAATLDLQEWVSEGLMAIFFFVVGLEIKRELVVGELRDPRAAALPAVAAIGGMVVPALIYVVINAGGNGMDGWGIPMATDIAMAVGIVSLLGTRVAPALRLFLLALAIVDDIGAIVVIAVFYSNNVRFEALAVAAGLVWVVVLLRWVGVRLVPIYAIVGVALWVALYKSGVSPTLAGVILGLLTPAVLRDGHEDSVAERLEHQLHPWSSFVVVPLFAFANAGIPISSTSLSNAFTSRITWGVILGLVIGKIVGVVGSSWIAIRLRLASLPPETSWHGILGIGAVAGIGFTVSIFVAGLAFEDEAVRLNEAKIGILVASIVAATVGSLILSRRERRRPL